MNVLTMISDINVKCNELYSMIKDLQSNVAGLSENTVRTQTFQKRKELHSLLVLKEVCNALKVRDVEEIQLHDTIVDWFKSLTTLSSTRKAKYEVTVKEGDSIMKLLQEHATVKDVWNKIQKSADKQGLMIKDGKIVRK